MDWAALFMSVIFILGPLVNMLEEPKKFASRISILVVVLGLIVGVVALIFGLERILPAEEQYVNDYYDFILKLYKASDNEGKWFLCSFLWICTFKAVWNFEKIVSDVRYWAFGLCVHVGITKPHALAAAAAGILIDSGICVCLLSIIIFILFVTHPEWFTWPFVWLYRWSEKRIRYIQCRTRTRRVHEVLDLRFGNEMAYKIGTFIEQIRVLDRCSDRIQKHIRHRNFDGLVDEMWAGLGVSSLEEEAFEGLLLISRPRSLFDDKSEFSIEFHVVYKLAWQWETGLYCLVSVMQNSHKTVIFEKAARMVLLLCLTKDFYYLQPKENWDRALKKTARACRAVRDTEKTDDGIDDGSDPYLDALIDSIETHEVTTEGLPNELFTTVRNQFAHLMQYQSNP